MIDKQISVIAYQFRMAIEECSRSEFPFNTPFAQCDFPIGCCGESASVLATYLNQRLNIVCSYISGTSGGNNGEIGSHAWLEYKDLVIDITGDQFKELGYTLPKVYVGKSTDWYSTFERVKSENGCHTSLNDRVDLDLVYELIVRKLDTQIN